jgi:hypothetical protein
MRSIIGEPQVAYRAGKRGSSKTPNAALLAATAATNLRRRKPNPGVHPPAAATFDFALSLMKILANFF